MNDDGNESWNIVMKEEEEEECSLLYFVHDNSWDGEFEIDFSHHCSSVCGCGLFQENDYPCIYPFFVIHPSSKEHVW